MDRLVKSDVKELEIKFVKGQKCCSTFRITNLMHTMPVAISLTTTNPDIFSLSHQFHIIPPLSTSSISLFSDQPHLSSPPDSLLVKSSMLPIGKASTDYLRNLFAKHGSHIFRDISLPIYFVGPDAVKFCLSSTPATKTLEFAFCLSKAIMGCAPSELTSLLRLAVAFGFVRVVASLIEAGGDVNFRDKDRESLLSMAIRSGDVDVVRVLIHSGFSVDSSVDRVWHEAAAINRVDLMEILYEAFGDANVNCVDLEGRSPIHVAAVNGHVESVRFLVSIGGDSSLAASDGWTALHCAASEGHLETVEVLLNCCSFLKDAITKDGKTAFSIAVDKGHNHLFDVLHLSDVLHRSARMDDVHGLRSSLAEGADVNGRDQNGWTPLHRAAFKGRLDSVKILIDHGAQVDPIDNVGYTPLHYAVEARHVKVAAYLITHGAHANIKSLQAVLPSNLDYFQSHPVLVHPLCSEKELARNDIPTDVKNVRAEEMNTLDEDDGRGDSFGDGCSKEEE
ncbi:Ankyrin repeat [Dillenia turbinata]|uniref:Ankyrin repeat n=1 Tax=Dillenia turbinata TaxID=194707 RepID=A0AAN8VTP5_9MAGN